MTGEWEFRPGWFDRPVIWCRERTGRLDVARGDRWRKASLDDLPYLRGLADLILGRGEEAPIPLTPPHQGTAGRRGA